MRLCKVIALFFVAVGISTLTLAHAAPEESGKPAAVNAAPQASTKHAKPDQNGYYVGGPVYVSDKNRIWTRSGPSDGYRVTGQRQIGDKMTFKRYSDNGQWAQLEGEDGESFWMKLSTLQPNSCGYTREAELTEKVSTLQERLDNYDSELSASLKQAQSEVERLSRENVEFKATLTEKESTIQELDRLYRDAAERLETKELDMQMRWWLQGALIALSGAIAGIIFVFIPRPSRKKRERY